MRRRVCQRSVLRTLVQYIIYDMVLPLLFFLLPCDYLISTSFNFLHTLHHFQLSLLLSWKCNDHVGYVIYTELVSYLFISIIPATLYNTTYNYSPHAIPNYPILPMQERRKGKKEKVEKSTPTCPCSL